MVKNFKLMQRQLNDLNKKICDLADSMHGESKESIGENQAAIFDVADLADENNDSIFDLADYVAELENRVSELEG